MAVIAEANVWGMLVAVFDSLRRICIEFCGPKRY